MNAILLPIALAAGFAGLGFAALCATFASAQAQAKRRVAVRERAKRLWR